MSPADAPATAGPRVLFPGGTGMTLPAEIGFMSKQAASSVRTLKGSIRLSPQLVLVEVELFIRLEDVKDMSI